MALAAEIHRLLDRHPELDDIDIADIAAALLMLGGRDASDAELAILAGFAERAGLTAGSSAADVAARVDAYFRNRPATRRVLDEVGRLVRESAANGVDASVAVQELLGQRAATGILGGGERPSGTAAGGPALRFAAGDLLTKKPK